MSIHEPSVMGSTDSSDVVKILLVEDDPGDVLITQEAFADSVLNCELTVVGDGEAALDYLYRRGEYAAAEPPSLVLLDLNLPKISGREVLAEIKSDPHLASLPVIVLSTSDADDDVRSTYQLHANAYVTKPVDYDRFHQVVRSIDDFFLTVVRLPRPQVLKRPGGGMSRA